MRFFWICAALILAACGNYRETNAPTPQSFNTLSFNAVKETVFRQQCFECHSAANAPNKGHGVNLEDYNSVKSMISKIVSDLDSDHMPRNRPPVPADLKQIVIAWANIGAPETTTVPFPTSSKPIPTAVIPIGFDQVRDKVFQPYCARCHAFMTDYMTVKANSDKILNAISSDMPKDLPPLSPELKALVQGWLDGGKLIGSEEIRQKILTPYCIRCHHDFNNGAIVSTMALDIWSKVWSDEMPRGGDPVPMDLKLKLDEWFKTGAAN